MFYRRKIILALLQTFGPVGKTQVQKLLLLFCQKQQKHDYHFVPYKYGAFSFSLAADITAMEKHSQITISNLGISKIDKTDFVGQLKEKDKIALRQIHLLHRNKSYSDLIKYTYTQYPYFAINSTIASRYLNDEQIEIVNSYKPTGDRPVLFTIGYEGFSLEEYINKLIANNVKILVDVRHNPQSMKYGFSKSQLINSCKSVGIEYIHFPQVGIISEQRQQLIAQTDYDALFENYKKVNLPNTIETQKNILNLLNTHKRVALTCFESNICQCHRKPLAEAITNLDGWHYELIHIK